MNYKIIREQKPNKGKKTWRTVKNWSTKTYTLITVITGLFGFTVYDFFTPKVELTASSILDPRDATMRIVTIQNKSHFSIYNVYTSMILDSAVSASGLTAIRTGLNYQQLDTEELRAGNLYSFNFSWKEAVRSLYPIIYANMAIKVDYKFLWFPCKDYFFFQCGRNSANEIIWVSMPEQDFVNDMPEEPKHAGQ